MRYDANNLGKLCFQWRYLSEGSEFDSAKDSDQMQIMTKQLIVGLVFSTIAVIGCGSSDVAQHEPMTMTLEPQRSDEDIAVETLNRMLEVATKGDWKAYVDHHYGEQHKFRSPADRDALVRRFEEKWGKKLVPGLSRAAKLPVQIDGDKAVFSDGDDAVFILHRSESGDWKFHL